MTTSIDELEQAILCAFQYASAPLSDESAQRLKHQAEQYCIAVKSTSRGWQLYLQLFKISTHISVKFYSLQALQEQLTKDLCDDHMTEQIRIQLLQWLHTHSTEMEQPFLKTKLAVVLTLLIKRDYPDRWSNAFTELVMLVPLGPSMVEMYFRILTAIHEEIVEFDATRTSTEISANMRIKDKMRESSTMLETFDTIYNVLIHCDTNAIMCQLSYNALETLKHYISWVDITLIVNDRFIPLLFKLVQTSAALRCPAANCIFEIINKGMTHEKKLSLILQLQLLEMIPTLPIQDDDEFAEEIAEIINQIGIELIECIDFFRHESNSALFTQASHTLIQLMPLVWDLFAHDTKNVSEEVFEIVNAIGTLIKSTSETNEIFQPSTYIQPILHGIYRQTRYPEENSDSDIAEFEEYRRSLYKIYVNITRHRPYETLEFLSNLAQELPQQFIQIDFRDLESFIALVYRYKEGIAAIKELTTLEQTDSPLAGIVIRIHSNMVAAVTAPGANILHATVLLTYYDLAVRYSRLLRQQSQLIPAVLNMMFGSSGLANPQPHVRSRVCYQCLQLIKAIGSSVHPQAQLILQALEPRLVVPAPLSDLQAQKQREKSPSFIPFDDQLYLFELSGQVIASAANGPETMDIKYTYTKLVLGPLVQQVEATLVSFQDGRVNGMEAGEHCANLLKAIANVLKAFKGTTCMTNQQEMFTSILTTATSVLSLLSEYKEVRSKVIFILHRLITVLDQEHLLIYIGEPLQFLMVYCEMMDVVEVVQLVNQLIIRYKQALYPFFDQTIMSFLQHVWTLMPARNDSADLETKDSAQLERELLQKYVCMFLLHIVQHNLSNVLLSGRNVVHLEYVLQFILEGCTTTDALINRGCFTIAHELVSQWLLSSPPSPELSVEGKARFIQLMGQEFTRVMFTVATKFHFDVNDAQCSQVTKEIAVLHEVLVKSCGQDWLTYLRDVCLPALGCPVEVATQYVTEIASGDRSVIRNAYKQIVRQWKTTSK